MTSTIKVDNIQNQCGANIINESSNTITIGASGDTVTLASGASQSGFGKKVLLIGKQVVLKHLHLQQSVERVIL